MGFEETKKPTGLAWNAGALFGSMLGGTAWAFLLGIVLLFEDPLSALVCLGGFVALNAYTFYLWRNRDKVDGYRGIRRSLLGCMVFFAMIIVVLKLRGVTESHTPLGVIPIVDPAHMPYWIIALQAIPMLWAFWQQRAMK